MNKEEYKAKKIAEFENEFYPDVINGRGGAMQDFLSQTIDELWALPNRSDLNQIVQDSQGSVCPSPEEIAKEVGWNDCIAEAERMRDNKLNKIYV